MNWLKQEFSRANLETTGKIILGILFLGIVIFGFNLFIKWLGFSGNKGLLVGGLIAFVIILLGVIFSSGNKY